MTKRVQEVVKTSFESDINKARIAERITWDILQHRSDTKQVIDVRDIKRYQRMDVDFLWETLDKEIYYIETKLDTMMHRTGNIAYEVSTSGNIGCFEKTEAQLMFYYDFEEKIMYVIQVAKLRAYVKQANLELIRMGDNATGHLIKVNDLIAQKIISKVYENME